MKKQYFILIGMILLIGSIIAVGELTPIIFRDKSLDVSLTTAEKQILNEKSNSALLIGNITCYKTYCMIEISRDNRLFTYAGFKLTKNITDYSESEFMVARDEAIQTAIKNKVKINIKPVNQKVEAGGNVNIR
jgi:hypothetical protein